MQTASFPTDNTKKKLRCPLPIAPAHYRKMKFGAAAVLASGLMLAGACSAIHGKADENGKYEVSALGAKADFSCMAFFTSGNSDVCISNVSAGPIDSQLQFWWNTRNHSYSFGKVDSLTNKQIELSVDLRTKSVKIYSN